MTQIEQLRSIERFAKEQTMYALQDMVNLGLTMKVLEHGEFVNYAEFKLPIQKQWIPLYKKEGSCIVLDGIGYYERGGTS